MLIRIPDDTPLYQLEYLANKIDCDLILGDDRRPEFVRRESVANVLRFPRKKPRKLVNRTRPDGPGVA